MTKAEVFARAAKAFNDEACKVLNHWELHVFDDQGRRRWVSNAATANEIRKAVASGRAFELVRYELPPRMRGAA